MDEKYVRRQRRRPRALVQRQTSSAVAPTNPPVASGNTVSTPALSGSGSNKNSDLPSRAGSSDSGSAPSSGPGTPTTTPVTDTGTPSTSPSSPGSLPSSPTSPPATSTTPTTSLSTPPSSNTSASSSSTSINTSSSSSSSSSSSDTLTSTTRFPQISTANSPSDSPPPSSSSQYSTTLTSAIVTNINGQPTTIYTTIPTSLSPSTPSQTSARTATIAGATAGAVVVLILALSGFFFYKRHQHKKWRFIEAITSRSRQQRSRAMLLAGEDLDDDGPGYHDYPSFRSGSAVSGGGHQTPQLLLRARGSETGSVFQEGV